MFAKNLLPIQVLFVFISGCSQAEVQQTTGGKEEHVQESQQPTFRAELFDSVYRVATELKAGQEVGMNREKFENLIQRFANEIAVAKDQTESPIETQVADGYAEVLAIYKDASMVWDTKLKTPDYLQMADDWDENMKKGNAKAGAAIGKIFDFKVALADGIPLNSFPDGDSTGIDSIVSQYKLPVTESKGWKTIPIDSIQVIWAKALEQEGRSALNWRCSEAKACAARYGPASG
jgi:hypothetical protein